ncbi:CopG family transcriptional regulator [Paraburkholderia sacchari]|uniref:CopG family transcriptional regulator n=1 Tax=Paraburkholderia sacchari TaxID=159450 RepID=UPI001BD0B40C|nr:CopG family transcriptional regulator [Paraburkholderia sacchari]
MRTTVDMDGHVLAHARARRLRAHVHRRVISQLARSALQRLSVASTTRNGLPVLPNAHTAGTVTPEFVNQMRDEAP